MRVYVKNVEKDYTACNFCRRGTYSSGKIIRPYENVIEFGALFPGITVAICKQCLAELINKAEGLL